MRRIFHSVTWLRAFFAMQRGGLHKVWVLKQWDAEPWITITTDASPWGLGATLEVRGELRAVLSDPISEDDEVRFLLKRGDC